VQCQETGDVSHDTYIRTPAGDIAFYDVFYRVDGSKSGYHHPDGILWIRTPARFYQEHQTKVPLTDITPTILDILDLEKPAHLMGNNLLETVYA
jgi:predicted AlkP superfamily phosphohydrolase/phosphomutase